MLQADEDEKEGRKKKKKKTLVSKSHKIVSECLRYHECANRCQISIITNGRVIAGKVLVSFEEILYKRESEEITMNE
jgi:hypothetical protein